MFKALHVTCSMLNCYQKFNCAIHTVRIITDFHPAYSLLSISYCRPSSLEVYILRSHLGLKGGHRSSKTQVLPNEGEGQMTSYSEVIWPTEIVSVIPID